MCHVIHAVEERYLLLVAFHLYVLPIDNKGATKAFSVAIVMRYLVVTGENFQFINYSSKRSTNASMSSVSKRTNACAL